MWCSAVITIQSLSYMLIMVVWMSAWPSMDWSCYQQHTQSTDQAGGAYALAYSIIVI
jgi:hypothetical protein